MTRNRTLHLEYGSRPRKIHNITAPMSISTQPHSFPHYYRTHNIHTDRNKLNEYGLSARRPTIGPDLTSRHRTDRLDVAKTPFIKDCGTALFTFCRRNIFRLLTVVKMFQRKVYTKCNFAETGCFCGGTIIVVGGIC